MTNNNKLIVIKAIHTLIWTFFNIVIFYMFYSVVTNRIDTWVWVCLSLISLEGLILLVFKRVCPITIVAREYSKSTKANFDIYLPNWLAKYNKQIYSIIVLIVLIILVYRLFDK